MDGGIFISYRRGADSGFAGRLYDRLEHSFGRQRVFMDVDSIAPGEDFVAVLQARVAECDVLLALIGRGWLNVTDAAGRLRLDNPEDFVRIEIGAALAQGKRVIPVVIDDVPFPRAGDLPEEIKPLARRQAIRIRHDRFRADAKHLIDTLERALADAEAARQAKEEARTKVEEEARKRREAEAEATRKAEEERQRAAAEAKWQAQGQERQDEQETKRSDEEKGSQSRVLTWWRNLDLSHWRTIGRLYSPKFIAFCKTKVVSYNRALGLVTGAAAILMVVVIFIWSLLPSPRTFRDCDVCSEMVALPGGMFLMGSPDSEVGRHEDEGPQHEVTIRSFAIGKYEVTFEEWDACVETGGCNGYRPDDEGWGRGRRPVINVSWKDAGAYCGWLAEASGEPYRLPSEAEWEYAARAGTKTRYAFGDEISREDANFGRNVGKTTEVGAYPANSWGLYDMHGNVWEWVADGKRDYTGAAVTDPMGPTEAGAGRVLRGGSWDSGAQSVRSAYRLAVGPDGRINGIGFRCARDQS